ncbi:MAG: dephospho-CoA kinase [Lachnospiraceae bacterium]|nr:dephospho-CoA kinase [Lachnospiraceae bacterium]
MRTIGITGGVGCGKTEIVRYLEQEYGAFVVLADHVAHRLEEPGQDCYNKLVDAFGIEILDAEGRIDSKGFASVIFSDNECLKKANEIIHPAVKDYIKDKIQEEKKKGTKLFVVEAALLIEDGYAMILDELWYVYAREETRRKRLKQSRGYTDEKIDSIMMNQMSEDEFRLNCSVIINNDGSLETAKEQINRLLGKKV